MTLSDNYTSAGEFERMLKKVGCYIRNGFYYENDTVDVMETKTSAIECAEACFQNSNDCQLGWYYQIASKRCLFMKTANINNLKPNSHLMETDITSGWASGLKSCSKPSQFLHPKYHLLFILIKVLMEVGVHGRLKQIIIVK